MTESVLKQINNAKITLTLSLDEARMVRHALGKEQTEQGIPTEHSSSCNLCPICNKAFFKNDNYCPNCGQRVEFNDSDIVPL